MEIIALLAVTYLLIFGLPSVLNKSDNKKQNNGKAANKQACQQGKSCSRSSQSGTRYNLPKSQ